ncbi:MAG: four helix bundle protein [Acidobacteriia bacterium]|nr:four helix bundle protein [Terriglobia bacterium]
MSLKSYRELVVWQRAMDLVEESYRLSKRLPKTEIYGLCSQIQRAAVSIPANIAEGHGREHLGDYLHHLSIANGSIMELETHLYLLQRLSFFSSDETRHAMELTGEVGRLLAGLIRSLSSKRIPHEASEPAT